MSKPIVIALAGLILVSCASVQAEVIDRAKEANDDAARALVAAPCQMSVGSFNRLAQHQRVAIDLLCGGNALRELQGLVQQ